jgi:hypothetical protein
VQRQRQALAGVQGRQEIEAARKGRDGRRLAAVTEAVGHGQQQRQAPGIEDKASPDDVAVSRVVGCGAARLDLYDDAVEVVEGVNVVCDLWPSVAPVQDRPPDPVGLAPACLYLVPESSQTWVELP